MLKTKQKKLFFFFQFYVRKSHMKNFVSLMNWWPKQNNIYHIAINQKNSLFIFQNLSGV